TPEPEDPLLAESRLLDQAVGELRRQHDPRASLRTLDEHAVRFPSGSLVSEARLLRIEALLAAGDRQEALTLLEHTDLDGLARAAELHVLQGELLAESGRCDEAV